MGWGQEGKPVSYQALAAAAAVAAEEPGKTRTDSSHLILQPEAAGLGNFQKAKSHRREQPCFEHRRQIESFPR